MASIPAMADARGRSTLATYVAAWRKVCEAVWQEELEDLLFRKAVELVEAHQPGPEAHWLQRLQREAWRDSIRFWWLSVRDCYSRPAEIPHDWLIDQREWETEGAASLNRETARAACPELRAHTWARVEALIETGEFWPLHLDVPQLARAQFETLREWVPVR
jgi:hypothetical protein